MVCLRLCGNIIDFFKNIIINLNILYFCRIKYITIDLTTHSNRNLVLNILQDDEETTVQEYRLVSDKAAQGLYRCITEMHSFFRCDTVRNVVSSQFSRDLKGTLASLFNENTSLGMHHEILTKTLKNTYFFIIF